MAFSHKSQGRESAVGVRLIWTQNKLQKLEAGVSSVRSSEELDLVKRLCGELRSYPDRDQGLTTDDGISMAIARGLLRHRAAGSQDSAPRKPLRAMIFIWATEEFGLTLGHMRRAEAELNDVPYPYLRC